MTLDELMEVADQVYPDGLIGLYYDEYKRGGYKGMVRAQLGDSLAMFLVLELADTFEADIDDIDQLDVAINVMLNVSNQVQGVLDAFNEKAEEIQNA